MYSFVLLLFELLVCTILAYNSSGTSPLNSQDLIGNSPNCLPNDSHYVSLENLVSDQLIDIFLYSYHLSA